MIYGNLVTTSVQTFTTQSQSHLRYGWVRDGFDSELMFDSKLTSFKSLFRNYMNFTNSIRFHFQFQFQFHNYRRPLVAVAIQNNF